MRVGRSDRKSVVEVIMQELAKAHREQLLDLLQERLAFERSGVKLYDSVIRKIERAGGPSTPMLGQLHEHRNQEKEHEEWLEAQIRDLDGDPQVETDGAKLVHTESLGLERVIDADDNVAHVLHALLTAELADNAGWELLVELADDADDDEAKKAFEERLNQEQEHLTLLRKAVLRHARDEVLGEDVTMPTSP